MLFCVCDGGKNIKRNVFVAPSFAEVVVLLVFFVEVLFFWLLLCVVLVVNIFLNLEKRCCKFKQAETRREITIRKKIDFAMKIGSLW